MNPPGLNSPSRVRAAASSASASGDGGGAPSGVSNGGGPTVTPNISSIRRPNRALSPKAPSVT